MVSIASRERTMQPERRTFEEFVDLVCLVYHEARNVQRPAVCRRLPASFRCDQLLSLSAERHEAWDKMRHVRAKAYSARSVKEVEQTFAEEYHISLDGLERLFNSECWTRGDGGHTYGGPKWAEICRRVTALECTLDGSDEAAVSAALSFVRDAEHNSHGPGGVRRKLEGLRRRCEGARGAGSDPSRASPLGPGAGRSRCGATQSGSPAHQHASPPAPGRAEPSCHPRER